MLIRKKHVLHELAMSLFLMLEFDEDTTAHSVIRRIRERAAAALRAASRYTGSLGEKELQDFLKIRPLNFTIHCGADIVVGDTIRFVEMVLSNRFTPSRPVGRRSVTAEVLGFEGNAATPMVRLRVITTGGVWDLKPASIIRRTLHHIVRQEVMRTAWSDEAKRAEAARPSEAFKRYPVIRDKI